MKDGKTKHTGTLISKDEKEVIIHNIAGIATKLPTANISKLAKSDSTIMGPHLVDKLTVKEFTDLVNYMYSLK